MRSVGRKAYAFFNGEQMCPTYYRPFAFECTVIGRFECCSGSYYALNLNYLELQEGRVMVTVRCGAGSMRFRVVAPLVYAKLVEGEHQPGMM